MQLFIYRMMDGEIRYFDHRLTVDELKKVVGTSGAIRLVGTTEQSMTTIEAGDPLKGT